MRSGVRLGVDVGKARVGVARTDPAGILAVPVETIQRSTDAEPTRGELDRVCQIASEWDAIEVYVGLPLNLRGEHTASTEDAIVFARQLQERLSDVEVRLIDERLSTVSASRALYTSGLDSRRQRAVIDQQAAVVLLEQALDIERTSGAHPGTALSDYSK